MIGICNVYVTLKHENRVCDGLKLKPKSTFSVYTVYRSNNMIFMSLYYYLHMIYDDSNVYTNKQ